MPKTKAARTTKKPAPSLVDVWSEQIIHFVGSKLFLTLALVLFALEASFFALRIRYALPPDENYHFSLIQLLAQNLPSPFISHQTGFSVVYDALQTPFLLYHCILAFVYAPIKGLASAFVILRLVNVGLGLGSLWVLGRIADGLRITNLARNISIFVLANTLMFVFISGAISYDNLFILICLLVIWAGLVLYRQISLRTLLILAALFLAGALTKVNFLPFGFFAAIPLAVVLFRRPRHTWAMLQETAGSHRLQNILLGLLIVLLGCLFVGRYGSNLARYHSYDPPCNVVRSLSVCNQSPLFARKKFLLAHKLPVTLSIPHYLYTWSGLMLNRTYGVFAQRRFDPNHLVLLGMLAYLLAGLACFVWSRPKNPALLALLFAIVGYMGVLLLTNYTSYRAYGRPDLAVHGRYAFNVLPLIYLFINSALLSKLKSNRYKALVLLAIIGLFFVSNIPAFLTSAPVDWYSHQSLLF